MTVHQNIHAARMRLRSAGRRHEELIQLTAGMKDKAAAERMKREFFAAIVADRHMVQSYDFRGKYRERLAQGSERQTTISQETAA